MATTLKSSLAILMLLNAGMVVVSVDVYGCYHQPDSPCSNFTITCQGSARIRMYNLQYYTKPPSTICPPLQDEDDCNTGLCCTRNSSDRPVPFSQQESLTVYTACTNQQSCTITSPYTPNSSRNYHLVHFGYHCTPENRIYNIRTTSTKSSESEFFYLYYGDKAPPSTDSSCSCTITGNTYRILYISLGVETCHRVHVLADQQPLFTCTGKPVFIPTRTRVYLQSKQLQININQYKYSYGDAILIQMIGPVNVTCDCENVVKSEWSEWSSYSPCSVSCGSGNQTRTRTCNKLADDATNCAGISNQTILCNQLPCSGLYVLWIVPGVAILAILAFAIIWFIRSIRTRINTARVYDTTSRQSTDNSPNHVYAEFQPRIIDDDHVCSPYLALVNTTNEYVPLNAVTRDDVHYRVLQPPRGNSNPASLSNVNVSN